MENEYSDWKPDPCFTVVFRGQYENFYASRLERTAKDYELCRDEELRLMLKERGVTPEKNRGYVYPARSRKDALIALHLLDQEADMEKHLIAYKRKYGNEGLR